jgi:hypothetical protein
MEHFRPSAGWDARNPQAGRVAPKGLWRVTWAVVHKELRHIMRNPLTLFLVTLSPALLLFMLANVFSFEVNHATLAVLDLAQSRLSRDYVTRIVSNDVLSPGRHGSRLSGGRAPAGSRHGRRRPRDPARL